MYQYKGITTEELIRIIYSKPDSGHQISRKSGLLNTTKCIYQKDNLIYLFDINEVFAFDDEHCYLLNDFKNLYENANWIYEYPIG